MKIIKDGIVASPGIVVGRAFIYQKNKLEISEKEISAEEVEEEIRLLEKAMDEYIEELESLEAISKTAEELMNTHVEIVRDPVFMEELKLLIGRGNNAQKALHLLSQEMQETLLALEDDYFKERALDYEDVRYGILCKLQGVQREQLKDLPENSIVVAEELTPTETSSMDEENIGGLLIDRGGKTSHVAIIAQTNDIPCVVALKDISQLVTNNDVIIIDALKNEIILEPSQELLEEYAYKIEDLARNKELWEETKFDQVRTLDGQKIEVAANIGSLESLDKALAEGADSIGLFRTEFLYMASDHFPTEEEQFKVYQQAVTRLAGKSLMIRTLDIGGDKELPYFDFPLEDNPFLGFRGIRVSFDQEERFKEQLRAVLRASQGGKVRLLLPMIISVEEIIAFRDLLEECKRELKSQGLAFDQGIEIGMMIETPASVILAEYFIDYVDFFSIGTNDLTQYALAVDRGNEKISTLYNTFHPAVLRMIKHVIDVSHQQGKWTGMCGSFASDLKATELLIGFGLDEFSVAPSRIPELKAKVLTVDRKEAEKLAQQVLACQRIDEVEALL